MLSKKTERELIGDRWLSWELLQRSVAGNRDELGVAEMEEITGIDFRSLRRTIKRAKCKARESTPCDRISHA